MSGTRRLPRQQRFRDYVREKRRASPYSLAADLIPDKGAEELQSENVRELAGKAFRGLRAR